MRGVEPKDGAERTVRAPSVVLPALALVFGRLGTVYLWHQSKDAARHQAQASFNAQARLIADGLREKLDLSFGDLNALQAFFDTASPVTPQKFQRFTRALLEGNSSLHALEWIPLVPGEQRGVFEESIQSLGFPAFEIVERNAQGVMVSAGQRPRYFPVAFVEPYRGNEPAHGFDLGSDPARLEALQESWEAGQMVATSKITLAQERGGSFGFLAFSPIYRKVDAERGDLRGQKALDGFVLGVFRVKSLVKQVLASLEARASNLELCLFDAPDPRARSHRGTSAQDPLFQSSVQPSGVLECQEPANEAFALNRYETALSLPGRTWKLVIWPSPKFIMAAERNFPVTVAALGFCISAGFALLTFLLLQTRARALAFTPCHLLGYQERELRGKSLDSVFEGEHVGGGSLVGTCLGAIVGSGRAQNLDVAVLAKDEERIPMSLNGAVMCDRAQRLVGVVCVARDMREIRRLLAAEAGAAASREKAEELAKAHAVLRTAHEQLKNTQAQLVQAGKLSAVGELAGGVAHELNSPLQAVLANAKFLEEDTSKLEALPEEIKNFPKFVDRAGALRELWDFEGPRWKNDG